MPKLKFTNKEPQSWLTLARVEKTAMDRVPSGQFFDNSDEWLTTKEAAEYLKVSEGTLRNMCCNGSVTYYKLHRRNRFRLMDLRDLLLKPKRGGFYEQ